MIAAQGRFRWLGAELDGLLGFFEAGVDGDVPAVEEEFGGLQPGVAAGPFLAVAAHLFAEFAVLDELAEGLGELFWVVGFDEDSVLAVGNGFGDASDAMGDDGESVGGGFEVDEAEAFDALAEVDAGHGEDVGAGVDVFELFVGDVAEEGDAEVHLFGEFAEFGLVAVLFAGADEPEVDLSAELARELGEGVEDEGLAFARVEASDGEDVYFFGGAVLASVDFGEVGAEGAGGEEGFPFSFREMLFQQAVGVFRGGADAVGPFDEGVDGDAFAGVGGEGLDLGAVEGEDELAWLEGLEELQVAHGQHRAGLAEVDDGFADASALADHFHGEAGLAAEVLAAFELESADGEGEFGVFAAVGLGGPDFDGAAQFYGGAGHFLREGGDPTLGRGELMGEY